MFDPVVVAIMARAIMLARHPGLLGSIPDCRVIDWVDEAERNPHVKQAYDQAIGALYALLDHEPTRDLANALLLNREVGIEIGGRASR